MRSEIVKFNDTGIMFERFLFTVKIKLLLAQ